MMPRNHDKSRIIARRGGNKHDQKRVAYSEREGEILKGEFSVPPSMLIRDLFLF